MRGLLELSPSALVGGQADGTLVFVNEAVEPLLGWRPEELVGRDVTCLWPRRFEGHYRQLLWSIRAERPVDGPALEGEYVLRRRDGSELTVHVASRWVDTDDGPVAICSLTDLSERDRIERLLRSLADADPLTGVLNRRPFAEKLETQVARAERYGEGGAVLVLDLDEFKEVNDTLGHQVGDAVLRAVAQRLRGRLRRSDVLARLGGDEFAVLLPQATREQGETVAGDLLDALRSEPFHVDGRRLRVTASVGVSVLEGRKRSSAAVMTEADLAMYDAKHGGRDRVAPVTAGGQERIRKRRALADRIADALRKDAFELRAQPILELESGEQSRLQLLLALPELDSGLVVPADVMSTAEGSRLNGAVDRWATLHAIELAGRGELGEFPGARLHLRLSSAALDDPELPRLVEAVADEHGVDASQLTFEIGERAALARIDATRAFASAVRALGAEVALDDFGHGYGSFQLLKHLPIDVLKLDGDFVRELPADITDRLVVRSLADVARGLGLTTVAKHVRDEPTLCLLRGYGVDCAQGPYVGEPQPVGALLSAP